MIAPGRWRTRLGELESGMVTAFVVVFTMALIAMAGLVLDGGLALSAKVQAIDDAQAAARAGAQAIDIPLYRSTGHITLDPPSSHPGRRGLPRPFRAHRHRQRRRRAGHRHGHHRPAHPDPLGVRDRPHQRRGIGICDGGAKPMTRLARLAGGLAALCVLAALAAGVPWALVHFVGWPLPHHVPSAAQVGRALDRHGIPAQALVDALAVVVWISWVTVMASVCVEVPAALSGRRPPRLAPSPPWSSTMAFSRRPPPGSVPPRPHRRSARTTRRAPR